MHISCLRPSHSTKDLKNLEGTFFSISVKDAEQFPSTFICSSRTLRILKEINTLLFLFSFNQMVLSQEDIDGCRQAFLAFDKDRSGTIDVWELRQVLEALGQAPTEDELFQMISEVDDNMSGSIDFGEFLKVVESQKNRAENLDDENDMIDAFVASGGQPDKSGHVRRDTLVKIIKVSCKNTSLVFYVRRSFVQLSSTETLTMSLILSLLW